MTSIRIAKNARSVTKVLKDSRGILWILRVGFSTGKGNTIQLKWVTHALFGIF